MLVISFSLTLISQLRGLYSWDYFTLWGTHPKYIWSTGNFWASGLDLPLKFNYQSIWGNLTGSLAYLIGPTVYFDSLWAIVNIGMIAALFGILTYCDSNRWEKISFIALLFAFIPSTIMGQQTWGGYVDLSAVLMICLGIKLFQSEKKKLACLCFIACILTKMTLWPWIIIIGGSLMLSQLSKQSIKDFLLYYVLPVAFGLLLMNLLYVKDDAVKSLSFYSLGFKMKPIAYILGIYSKSFFSINGIMSVILIYGIVKKEKFVIMYTVFGMLYITLVYLLFLDSTPTEDYPSIKRYLFPIFLPLIFYIFDQIQSKKILVLASLSLVLSLARVTENYSTIKNFKFAYLIDYCSYSRNVCDARDVIKSKVPGDKKEIKVTAQELRTAGLSNQSGPNVLFYVGLPHNFIITANDADSEHQNE